MLMKVRQQSNKSGLDKQIMGWIQIKGTMVVNANQWLASKGKIVHQIINLHHPTADSSGDDQGKM